LFVRERIWPGPVAHDFDADGDVYVAEMIDLSPVIRTPGMYRPVFRGPDPVVKDGTTPAA